MTYSVKIAELNTNQVIELTEAECENQAELLDKLLVVKHFPKYFSHSSNYQYYIGINLKMIKNFAESALA